MASINERNLKLGDKSKFQLILVGLDNTEEENEAYIKDKHLNFPALKLAGREPLVDLLQSAETGFIPNVAIVKPDGSLVTNDETGAMAKLNELAPKS